MEYVRDHLPLCQAWCHYRAIKTRYDEDDMPSLEDDEMLDGDMTDYRAEIAAAIAEFRSNRHG